MLLPYTVDVPMTRLPLANWALMGVTLVLSTVFLLARTPPPVPDPRIPEEFQAFAHLAHQRPAPALALQPERFSVGHLVSYVLVHRDWFHLVGNLFFLFCFGNALNAKLGHLPFLVLYFGMGMVAGLAWLALGQDKPLTGASGAIMGMVGVFLVLYPRNDVRIFYLGMRGMGSYERPSWWIVILGMVSDLVGTLSSPVGAMDYLCHLGVELFGIFVGAALIALGLVESERYEENLLQLLGLPTAGLPRFARRNTSKTGDPPAPLRTWARRSTTRRDD